VNDPETTWTGWQYAPPRNANHETNAPNRWQVLLFAACFAVLPFRREWRVKMLGYALALIAGFVLFCFYLKWQPFMARMFLSLFVLACPVAGVVVERVRPSFVPVVMCVLLLINARPALFENWVRPLKGERSLLRTPRDLNYFADMTQWNNRDSYLAAVNEASTLGCPVWGIDINDYQLEYPFEALLKARAPGVRFVHTGVRGPSAKYARAEKPCAVLCLDCARDAGRIGEYRNFGSLERFGDFLIFH
jgi:energy-coupling factor transporter transmembrane protein EcfT